MIDNLKTKTQVSLESDIKFNIEVEFEKIEYNKVIFTLDHGRGQTETTAPYTLSVIQIIYSLIALLC